MNRRDIVIILLSVILIVGCVVILGRIESVQDREETEIVRDAVREAALTCYAVEGAYPDSVDYLRENYRLAYDEERYFITYEMFASNRIPDIYVVERGAGMP